MASLAQITTYLLEFVAIFFFILVTGYLIPCGKAYYAYFIRTDEEKQKRQIQTRRPTRSGIRREIIMSIQSIFIFASMGTGLLEMYKAGMTSIYWNTFAYPIYYIPISFVLCLVIHDTLFYWSHRFMHWRPVFKYFHAGHHKSVSPSPWAIFAFQPLEAILQFASLMLIIVFVPLKPIVLLAYLSYDTFINIAGHTGFEIVPDWMSRHWFFKGFNNVSHHDGHHTNMHYNYGAFFNVWDRWMGTFLDNDRSRASMETTSQFNRDDSRELSQADEISVPCEVQTESALETNTDPSIARSGTLVPAR
jgi:Delta7-sterol 5-desaturase